MMCNCFLSKAACCLIRFARSGIDLATSYDKRDVEHDLDHIMLDAMLEGFDTGASC